MKKLFFLTVILCINSSITAQWISQDTNFPTDFNRGIDEIRIVDAKTVWAKSYNSETGEPLQEFTRTTDGGTTWIPGKFDISNPSYIILNISPISATTAWISAIDLSQGTGKPTPGGVWKTSDGGTTWVEKNTIGFKSISSFINGVHFFDANNGISYGDPVDNVFEIYKTSDGGETWTAIPGSSIPAPEAEEFGSNSIDINTAVGGNFWIGTSKGSILRSTDMGTTWTKLKSPINNFSSNQEGGIIKFSDKNNGLIWSFKDVGSNFPEQKLYRTTDGGNTWSTGELFPYPFQVINYIPGTTKMVGVGVGTTPTDNNIGYHSGYSNDNGNTWRILDKDILRNNTISFFDENTGWVCSDILTSTNQAISKFDPQFLSVANFNSTSKFSVYPIPTTGNIKLSSVKNTIGNVIIHNVLGKEVFNTKFNNLNNEVSIDLSTIDNGIYFLKATTQQGEVETYLAQYL
jgi:photosystem II stability/assembly factor-like uncharacterized protein